MRTYVWKKIDLDYNHAFMSHLFYYFAGILLNNYSVQNLYRYVFHWITKEK